MGNQMESTTTTKTNILYYIGAAIVAVVVISVLLLVFLLPRDQCKLSYPGPSLTELLKKKKNHASADNTALANMIGYLYFFKKGFLPLVLSKFAVDNKTVTLASECATLTWDYEVEYSEPTRPKIMLHDLHLNVPTEVVITESGFGSNHTCIVNARGYSYSKGQRFSCQTEMSGGCQPEIPALTYAQTDYVQIVMGSLELELLGYPQIISKGEFSHQEYVEGSCSLFTND